jgi:tRNA G18 (ribose-2'-O)-methylase SpoU
MRKLSHNEIVERQTRQLRNNSRLPFCVLLNNIRSLYNVGSIFRTADGAGVEKIWLCGFTGYPPQAQISKTALGAEDRVPWEYSSQAVDVLKRLKEQHYQIVFLEQTKESVSYHQFEPQPPVCLVVGNEITGVDDNLLAFCDQAIEIEMSGVKNSLNVSVAFGIAAYQLKYQLRISTRA